MDSTKLLLKQDLTCETYRHDDHLKVALVTGSATGIGANIAIDLSATGKYLVIVTGRDVDKLNEVVDECKRKAPQRQLTCEPVATSCLHEVAVGVAIAFPADLSDVKQIDKLIEFIKQEFGRLDLLVNNACYRGDSSCKSILDRDAYTELKKVMHINVYVPLYLIRLCLLDLRKKRSSVQITCDKQVVINISSVASKIVVPLHLYSISKACLSELTRQIALMSKDYDLHAVTVSPGPVFTPERPYHDQMKPLTLLNRVGSTQEISELVIFVAQNAHMFSGKELDIDGGYKVKQLALTKCFY